MSPSTRRQTLFVAVFLVVVFAFVMTYRMAVVHGESMEPTYQNGQVVLVRRAGLLGLPLHHNDVILIRKDRDVLIKRVYRLPGEEIDDPEIRRLTFFNNVADYYEQKKVQTPEGEVTRLIVPEGFVVVLGDNRRVSEDSRLFGPLPLRNVLGTVVGAPPPPAGLNMTDARPGSLRRAEAGNPQAALAAATPSARRPVPDALASGHSSALYCSTSDAGCKPQMPRRMRARLRFGERKGIHSMSQRVLFVGGCPASYHRLEPIEAPVRAALESLGLTADTTGIYHPDGGDAFVGDYSALTAENLKQYDLVLLHTTGAEHHGADVPALVDFVTAGKALVGLHNAADSFTKDADYIALLGGKFRTHPAPLDITVEIMDRQHPITQGLHDFTLNDELYLFSDYDPAQVHLLAQTQSYDDNGPIPIAWTREPGAGRVFYLSLGHRPETFAKPNFLTFFKNGVEWALRRR